MVSSLYVGSEALYIEGVYKHLTPQTRNTKALEQSEYPTQSRAWVNIE